MKLLGIIPKDLRDLKILSADKALVAFDDAVYEMTFFPRIKIKECGRWTGATAYSVGAIDEKKLLGTSIGIIIFGDKASPLYSGGKSLIFHGNFSPKHKIAVFVQSPEKIERIIDVYLLSSEDLLKSRRLSREKGHEITFFGTNVGPVENFRFELIKGLILIKDIDGDGFDELIIITPEEITPRLQILDYDVENNLIKSQVISLPDFLREPLQLAAEDIDGDGAEEIFILSRSTPTKYFIIVLKLYPTDTGSYNARTYVISQININELFGEVSDDGFLQVKLCSEPLPHFLLFWIEPPDYNEYLAKIRIAKLMIDSNVSVCKGELRHFPPKQLIFHGKELPENEIIFISDFGISRWKILESDSEQSRTSELGNFYTLTRIDYIRKIGQKVLIGGCILEEPIKLSTIHLYDPSTKEYESLGIIEGKIKQVEYRNDKLLILTDLGLYKCDLLNNVMERMISQENLVGLIVDKDTILVAGKKKVVEYLAENEHKWNVREIMRCKSDEEIVEFKKIGNKVVLGIINNKELMIKSLNGEILWRVKIDPQEIRFVRFFTIKDAEILITRNKILLRFNGKEERTVSLNISEELTAAEIIRSNGQEALIVKADNIVYLITPQEDSIQSSIIMSNVVAFSAEKETLLVALTDRKIVKYNVSEVFQLAESG
ncbi:MAG: FG-GAP repeat domain-containing protein [Candidatus Njordarchaeales archaeon]